MSADDEKFVADLRKLIAVGSDQRRKGRTAPGDWTYPGRPNFCSGHDVELRKQDGTRYTRRVACDDPPEGRTAQCASCRERERELREARRYERAQSEAEERDGGKRVRKVGFGGGQ